MEIEYKGANCVTIKVKQAQITVDPKLSDVDLKDQAAKASVQLVTQNRFEVKGSEAILLNGPGEYEIGDISIVGIAAKAYTDMPDEGKRATIYKISTADFSVVVMGHVMDPLDDVQLESIGVVDIVVVPIGGNGYTLDAHGAVKMIRQIDPKVVIPTHYSDKAIKYEVPQDELEPFTKELGVATEEMPKLKLKPGVLPETLNLFVITRTS